MEVESSHRTFKSPAVQVCLSMKCRNFCFCQMMNRVQNLSRGQKLIFFKKKERTWVKHVRGIKGETFILHSFCRVHRWNTFLSNEEDVTRTPPLPLTKKEGSTRSGRHNTSSPELIENHCLKWMPMFGSLLFFVCFIVLKVGFFSITKDQHTKNPIVRKELSTGGVLNGKKCCGKL